MPMGWKTKNRGKLSLDQQCNSVVPHSALSLLYKISGITQCKALAEVQSRHALGQTHFPIPNRRAKFSPVATICPSDKCEYLATI